MAKIISMLQKFRAGILSSVYKNTGRVCKPLDADDKIVMGLLLWAIGSVVEADDTFRPEEETEIKEVLSKYSCISEDDFPIVLAAVRQAAMSDINIDDILKKIGRKLPGRTKTSIMEDLIRIGYSDGDLNAKERLVLDKAGAAFGFGDNVLKRMDARIAREMQFHSK